MLGLGAGRRVGVKLSRGRLKSGPHLRPPLTPTRLGLGRKGPSSGSPGLGGVEAVQGAGMKGREVLAGLQGAEAPEAL